MALDLGLEEKDWTIGKEVEDLGGSRKGREMGGARGGAKGMKPSLGELLVLDSGLDLHFRGGTQARPLIAP